MNSKDSETDANLLFKGLSYTAQLTQTTTFWLDPYSEDCSADTRVPLRAVIYSYPKILTPLLIIEQCDEDDSNDGIALFNLTGFESKLSLHYQNETFEYFTSIDLSQSSKIVHPEEFQNNAFEQIVYVKVTAPGDCLSLIHI